MKVAIIYNKPKVEGDGIHVFDPKFHHGPRCTTVEWVADALRSGGHDVRLFDANKYVGDKLQGFMHRKITPENPAMVFNLAREIQDRSCNVHVPAFLEMLGMPYVGSGPEAHVLAVDRVLAKLLFLEYGIPIAHFFICPDPRSVPEDLVFPLGVRPRLGGRSEDFYGAKTRDELKNAVLEINRRFQEDAVLETLATGRHFAVALIGNRFDLEALPVLDIDSKDDLHWMSGASKPTVRRASISNELTSTLTNLAKKAFIASRANDFARFDFRVASSGHITLVEQNLSPGLARVEAYLDATKVVVGDPIQFMNRILQTAAARCFPAH